MKKLALVVELSIELHDRNFGSVKHILNQLDSISSEYDLDYGLKTIVARFDEDSVEKVIEPTSSTVEADPTMEDVLAGLSEG